MIEYETNAVFLHKQDYDELLDLLRRTRADFENHQKRAAEERRAARADAVRDFLRDFLPALDALGAAAAGGDPGLDLTYKEFLRVLALSGVARMETVGKPFDPNYHEAVGVVETAQVPEGAVAEELRAGWLSGPRVLRAALVKIAKR